MPALPSTASLDDNCGKVGTYQVVLGISPVGLGRIRAPPITLAAVGGSAQLWHVEARVREACGTAHPRNATHWWLDGWQIAQLIGSVARPRELTVSTSVHSQKGPNSGLQPAALPPLLLALGVWLAN